MTIQGTINETCDCPFCSKNNFYIKKKYFPEHIHESFILYQTPNFIVVPDIAPIVEGHLLIISKKHYPCYGKLEQNYFHELIELKEKISKFLARHYQNPLFFEHGPAVSKHAGCCIDHAHLHCLPINIDLTSSIYHKLHKIRINSIEEICKYSVQNISYLYYETNKKDKFIYPLSGDFSVLPSQYLRKVIASKLNLPQWNWRDIISDPSYQDSKLKQVINIVKYFEHDSMAT